MELLPHLEQFGTVDIFLSGANNSLALDAPVKYRSNGLSLFYNCAGGLDYWKIMKGYLPSYCEPQLEQIFHPFKEFRFQIFSKETSQLKTSGNIQFIPVHRSLFNQSLIYCTGIITGGGFE